MRHPPQGPPVAIEPESSSDGSGLSLEERDMLAVYLVALAEYVGTGWWGGEPSDN